MSIRADWRQGHVIANPMAIPQQPPLLDDERLVVITHDCDIANNNEAKIEVIRAKIIPALNNANIHTRQVRELHITYQTRDADIYYLSLTHAARASIEIDALLQEYPDDNLILSFEQKRSLKQWLAARYGRPAFPNHYQKRIGKIEDFLEKRIKRMSKDISAIYIDLQGHINDELPEGKPYPIRISIIYNSEDGPDARINAEALATQFYNKFIDVYGKPDEATEIALEECIAVADDRFSLYDIKRAHPWRLEYMSLRKHDDDVMLHEHE
jgi:hypothetical protein